MKDAPKDMPKPQFRFLPNFNKKNIRTSDFPVFHFSCGCVSSGVHLKYRKRTKLDSISVTIRPIQLWSVKAVCPVHSSEIKGVEDLCYSCHASYLFPFSEWEKRPLCPDCRNRKIPQEELLFKKTHNEIKNIIYDYQQDYMSQIQRLILFYKTMNDFSLEDFIENTGISLSRYNAIFKYNRTINKNVLKDIKSIQEKIGI